MLNYDNSSGTLSWDSSSTEPGAPFPARYGAFHVLKRFIFRLIRPLFVKNVVQNEDFDCIECAAPVLRRVLFCSRPCHLAHMDRWAKRFGNYR